MSDAERRFHEQWLGLVQPSEGLVVSVPVLLEAQCMQRLGPEMQAELAEVVTRSASKPLVLDLSELLRNLLDLEKARFDTASALPRPLRLYVPERKQELRPTRALRWGVGGAPSTLPPPSSILPGATASADRTAAAETGARYAMLIWEVPPEVENLDRPETVTGPWEYPARAKFERLLRECRVPIGLLSNGRELRLFYAPHGESTGTLQLPHRGHAAGRRTPHPRCLRHAPRSRALVQRERGAELARVARAQPPLSSRRHQRARRPSVRSARRAAARIFGGRTAGAP